MKLQQVIMRGPGILVSAMVVVVCGACEHAPDPEYDQGMPEAGGRFVTLRGADDVGVLSVDSPVTLSFDREEKFFHGANDAALLSEGSVAIANQQSGEIFVFDASGRFVRTVGRPGSGPGEFRNLKSVIAIEGDTIVALDGSSRTVSLFASTGEFIDGYKIDAPPEAIPSGSTEKMPYYRDAVVGTDGIVWLEPYETWRAGERMYVGYDSTGAAVGKLRFPGSDRLLEIGNGIAVVRRTEDLGTVNIYMQRYRRP